MGMLKPVLCQAFMDCAEFQRLRRVKQLGMVHFTYPSAVYTRFEHSIGVMYIAGNMVDQLRKYVDISQRTKDLIQLAGLSHDLGHFAYSHLFDKALARLVTEHKNVPDIFKMHDHEDRSVFFCGEN